MYSYIHLTNYLLSTYYASFPGLLGENRGNSLSLSFFFFEAEKMYFILVTQRPPSRVRLELRYLILNSERTWSAGWRVRESELRGQMRETPISKKVLGLPLDCSENQVLTF